MSDKQALAVVEQQEIEFYGDTVTAVLSKDGAILVPIRPICESLGIDWSGQRQRINRDPVLSKYFVGVTPTKSGRGNPTTLALPLDYLNGWLFGISAARVKESVRDKLVAYQEDCYKVLADVFGRNQVTARPLSAEIEALLQESDDPSAIAYRQMMVMANLAREQVMLKYQMDQRFGAAEIRIDQNSTRIDQIEAALGNADHFVHETQAMELSQAVKTIALELGKRSGRNEFGGTYGELYRRFEVTSYKRLPAAKFNEAMNFLRDWYSSVVGGDVPF